MLSSLFDYAIEFAKAVRKDRKRLIIASLGVFGLMAALFGVLGQFVILLLTALSVVVAFFVGEFMVRHVGIELVTFTSVFTGFLFGPVVGFFFGCVLLAVHLMLSKLLGPYVIYCIPMMGVVGMLSGYAGAGGWFGGNIALIGIMLSLLYNLVTGTLGTIFSGNFFKELMWNGTNFALNFVLFAKVAPIILAIIM